MGVLWPTQTIWSCRQAAKTAAAMASRLARARRPSARARWRRRACSSTPDRSASRRASRPFSGSTCLIDASWRIAHLLSPSRAAAELRAVAVDVLDLRRMSPRDLVRADPRQRRPAGRALLRAGRANGPARRLLHDAAVQAGRRDQIRKLLRAAAPAIHAAADLTCTPMTTPSFISRPSYHRAARPGGNRQQLVHCAGA